MQAISFDQVQQLEYLLMQSAKGNHLLFNMGQIKKVFLKEGQNIFQEMSFKKMDEIKQLMEELIKRPTLSQKKEYIENLPEASRELVIRTYFNILDNTLYQQKAPIH